MDDQRAFEFEIVNADDEDHTLNNTITDSCELVDASIEDVRNNKKEAVMTDKMVNPEDDSTLNNTITSSCEIVDVTIEDVRNNKKILASTMDLVISLMREVECKEKAVEQTKGEAATSGLAILAKVEELKQAHQHAKETNDTHAKEVYAQKVVLAAEMKELQFRVSGVLNEGGTSVGVLDEMRKALEKRLTSALREKELADKEKLEKELSAQKALAYEESQMKKLEEESERLKLEAMKNAKLQEFLTDRGRVVDMLDGDMSKKCQDVSLLKESLDQEVSLSEVLLSSQTPSIIASLTSFLTNEIPNEGNQPDDSHVILEKSFSFGIDASSDDHVQSATEKQIKTPCIIASLTSVFNNTSHSVTSASTTTPITTTTSAANTIFSSSVPALSTTPKTSIAETGNNTNDKEPKPTTSSLPFTTPSFATTTNTAAVAGSGIFGFSFPAATSATSGTQANTQATSTAVTQSVPFSFSSLYGSSTPSFGSSTSFGVSSIAALSEGKSGNSTSGTVFGSTWPAAPQSSGFGSTFTSSPFSFGASSSTPTPPATTSPITFGSSFPTAGTTNSSFATPSQTRPIFGNPSPLFEATTVSPNNNDQMSMEDSMAEDSMQTPGPVFPFGQPPAPAAAPGFMFGAATPTQTQPAVPFQFGGQPNQTPPQNPFQSSSLEFNGGGGGSFSLGSVGDKSGRRTIKVKSSKNRRK